MVTPGCLLGEAGVFCRKRDHHRSLDGPLRIQGYLAHKKQPTPQDRHRSLGMVLL